jgi:hypothetical protein
VFGSCWPAFVGFLAAFAYMFIQMHGAGYFGNLKYQHELGEWKVIMFPLMIGTLVGLSALGINAVLFAVVRPKSKPMTFLIGALALPVAVAAGIGLKCLL